jgi:hypothetical protein
MPKFAEAKFRVLELGGRKVRPVEPCFTEVCVLESGAGKVRPDEIYESKVGPGEVRPSIRVLFSPPAPSLYALLEDIELRLVCHIVQISLPAG